MVATIENMQKGICPLVPVMEERSWSESLDDRKVGSQDTEREAQTYMRLVALQGIH